MCYLREFLVSYTLLPVLKLLLNFDCDCVNLGHNMSHLPTTSDWRDLARQVQNERDPRKMLELAEQLVAKLDEELDKTAPVPISTEKLRRSFSEI